MEQGSEMSACPQCGNPTDTLMPIETGMRLALQQTGESAAIHNAVCANCYAQLSGQVSKGFKLRVEQDARNKNKVMMWKNRVSLIRQARTLMSNKAYSEAAVAYEKYLRVLEVVYNLDRGGLSPAIFNNSNRSKEMSVIASAYWDLMRIYDTSPAYGERMQAAADKLAQFLPFSQLYPDITKKAEQFLRNAKNPHIVRQFLRQTRGGKGACFIATAVFADEPAAMELFVLRRFRDQVLKRSLLGRHFVFLYYKYSPAVARSISRHPFFKKMFKPILRRLTVLISKLFLS